MPVTVFKYYLKLRYLNTVLNSVVALTPCFKLTSCLARRDSIARTITTATWLGGWLAVIAGIVSKRLNLS